MTWCIAVAGAWTFLFFVPRVRRLRARYGWPPPEGAPTGESRLIAGIVAGATVMTAILFVLVRWEPAVAFVLGPLVLYGFLTIVVLSVEHRVENAAERESSGGG